MGESACLMQNYSSHVPETASGDKENSIFGGSISFGRFTSESLAWERWSSFSHNRYLEEVEKYSTPGTVAQKKAYFEAHYKRIAAKKAAALLAENNSESNSVSEAEQEERLEENSIAPQHQVEGSGFHLIVNKPCEVENHGPVHVAPHAQNGVGLDENVDEMEIQNREDADLLEGDLNPPEIQLEHEPLKQLGDSKDLLNAGMEHSRACATEMSMAKETLKGSHEKLMLKEKKSNSSAIKSNNSTRIAKILPSPLRPFSSGLPKQETSACPSSRKPIQESASTPKSRKPKQESIATPKNLRPKLESGVTMSSWKPKQESSATPKSRRPKQESSATPNSLKTRQESGTTPRSWKPRQESSATPSSRRSTTDPIEKKRSASKSLHMSPSISHSHVHEIPHSLSNKRDSPILENSRGTKVANSKTNSDTLYFGQRKAATSMSLNGAPKLTSMNPLDNKRIKTPSGHTTPKHRISDKKWQSFSVDHSKHPGTFGRNAFSPTISVGFNFKSEERAAKRKEFFQKLEDKFNAKEAQEEKDKGERNSSQSISFKAKPMPDFYHEKRLPRNQIKKVPVTRPKSPKLGRKQNLTVAYDVSSSQPPPRPPVRTGISKNRKETQYFANSPNKKAHENTSPNIQSQ